MIYVLEFIVKVIGLGFKNYIRSSSYNLFDLFNVVISVLDGIISISTTTIESDFKDALISALKASRIIVIFKLPKYWRSFEILLETIRLTLGNIGPFTALIVVTLLTYTLLGLELFANKARFNIYTVVVDHENGIPPTFNFDSFIDSLYSVFEILTNDGQSLIYFNYYRAVSSVSSTIFWLSFVILA